MHGAVQLANAVRHSAHDRHSHMVSVYYQSFLRLHLATQMVEALHARGASVKLRSKDGPPGRNLTSCSVQRALLIAIDTSFVTLSLQ